MADCPVVRIWSHPDQLVLANLQITALHHFVLASTVAFRTSTSTRVLGSHNVVQIGSKSPERNFLNPTGQQALQPLESEHTY
ncbi:hypothetical protein NPIL_266981 [Nephila pilipes]|uniref:Uncharacterized protein n=1 Tax=Nephila pilipes TaxID=299642 RepID=A0A8X6UCG0_NEPPI|nr:hypothetical protein NPIL_266981 [Nephila pilipes]